MSLTSIQPADANRLVKDGALLIDIREADEYARENIRGAKNVPLSRLGPIDAGTAQAVVFHCKSGMRTTSNAAKLAANIAVPGYVMETGIDGWKQAGLPVVRDDKQPIEVMRQVQITAGSLVLAGVILGMLVSPGFYWLSAFIGAGLVFAGVSGWCGMAKMLALMPWNRQVRTA